MYIERKRQISPPLCALENTPVHTLCTNRITLNNQGKRGKVQGSKPLSFVRSNRFNQKNNETTRWGGKKGKKTCLPRANVSLSCAALPVYRFVLGFAGLYTVEREENAKRRRAEWPIDCSVEQPLFSSVRVLPIALVNRVMEGWHEAAGVWGQLHTQLHVAWT